MKINMPVTDVEYVLKETDSIVSKTDLSGAITYVNDDFIRVSGFNRDELIGSPHNIVRHPSMPQEAYADLWKSLKQGRPWTGLVKNRCKDGSFYWVLANATPFYEGGRIVGYMSVRSKPDSTQVAEAEQVYRLFREGNAGNLRIRDGKVIRLTLWEKLFGLVDLTIKTRLTLIISALSLSMLLVGGIGLYGMGKANEGLHLVYQGKTLPISQLASIQELLLTNRIRITAAANTPTPEVIQKNTDEVEHNTAEITSLWEAYSKNVHSADEKKLAEDFVQSRKHFVAEGLKPAIASLRANDINQANQIIGNQIRPLYEPVAVALHQLIQLQINGAQQEYRLADGRYIDIRNISLGLIFLSFVLAFLSGMRLINSLVQAFKRAIVQLTNGDYSKVVRIERHDELGKVMEALKAMQIKLGFEAEENRRIAAESLRIKIGLDNVSTGVMIADNDRKIIYVNKSVVRILGKAEADIRKQLPNFTVGDLLGSCIDNFHVNPAHQAQLLSTFTNTYTAKMTLGGRSMVVSANPVIDAQGKRLGTVAEWQDRTAEVAVEQEVADLVHGAVMGDFSRRIDLQNKDAFFKQLGEGLNELMEMTESGINDVARVLSALSQNDLTQSISNDYAGSFAQLKDDVNTMVDKLKDIIGQIRLATDSINTGAKEIASGNNDLSHRTEEQAASLEETAASMEQLTSTVQHNAANAQQASQLAVDASDIAGKGVRVVGQVVQTMDEINESSRKIGDIISVIDDIAFQTNILALNAAVEAARAGEQGRGFAVVAVEVRNLAQRAATAAGEIKKLIDDSVVKVSSGTKLVTQAGQTMTEIVESIHGVTVMMSEISAASSEQTAGIQQVNQAIGQMDDVTQQNAALVEQAAAAAESLEEQAQSLSNTVSQFNVGHEGGGHRSSAAHRTPQPVATSKSPAYKKPAYTMPAPIPSASADEWEEF